MGFAGLNPSYGSGLMGFAALNPSYDAAPSRKPLPCPFPCLLGLDLPVARRRMCMERGQ